jgi:hypothetical protein
MRRRYTSANFEVPSARNVSCVSCCLEYWNNVGAVHTSFSELTIALFAVVQYSTLLWYFYNNENLSVF